LIPSLLSLYTSSAISNSVPDQWKNAIVSSLYKKDDETEKSNYRPISLLCVPGILMETCVSKTITTQLADHELSHTHQWAYKKGHSTELLLVKMTDDWRRALDNNLVVGVVFVDFRFDLSPNLAEETSRARCIGQSLVVDKELFLESPSSDCDQWSCIEVNAC
jgi:hypothetical protein